MKGDGVRITTIYMPLVRTPMSDAIAHRPRRVATPVGRVVDGADRLLSE